MQTLLQDLRFAARTMARNPGFTALCVLVLALGIGANTAIFSVVHAVLLRPLPYPEAEQLFSVAEARPHFDGQMSIAWPNYADWREAQRSFRELSVYQRGDFNLTGDGEPERLRGARVTANYFPAMGLSARLGRAFREDEDRPGAPAVAVLGENLWRGRFGADPRVLGRTLTLNGVAHEVIGVMPAALTTPRNVELYVSLGATADQPTMSERSNHPGIYGLARLRPGVSLAQAEAEFANLGRNLEKLYPNSNTGNAVKFTPLLESAVGEYRATLWLLLGAVGFVLLIACANLANLLLARAAGRSREMALRAALGATRGRLVAQLLTESVGLAVLGGGLGLLLALWGVDLIVALSPRDVPRFREVRVDGVVLAFMALVTLGTGLLFGLFPAWKISRADLNVTLKEAGHGGTAGPGRQRGQALLVIGQVTLACVLLVGAGLLLRSFQELRRVRLGFEPAELLTAGLNLRGAAYRDQPERVQAFFQRLTEAVAALPGVRAAATSNNPPFSGGGWQSSFGIVGRPDAPPGGEPSTEQGLVTPDYFRAMGMPILRGRNFDANDVAGRPGVVIVDEAFARRHFPGEDPLGKQLHDNAPAGEERRRFTIVGVVPTVRRGDLADAEPKFVQSYRPAAQEPLPFATLLVRTAPGTDPRGVTRAVRAAVAALDGDQPLFQVETMSERIAEALAARTLSMKLVGLFSALALGLAALGLYGVLAYAVSQRTRELGIRLALGASRGAVFGLVLRQGLGLVAVGLGLGLVCALALARVGNSFLYGVGAGDFRTLAGVVLTLGGAAFLACWLPARRATRIDPMLALRQE